MKNLPAVALVALALTLAPAVAAQAPECASGWKQVGPARLHSPENLFDYMDGNAEGYLLYHFLEMKGVTCRSGEDTILVDVFEMADPEFAYGIFSANRDTRLPTEAIGMGGQVRPRRAIFAKDKYYVEIAANPEKDHTAALRAFLSAMEKRISGRSTLPETLGWFPKEKLLPDSVRLVPESVLGLRVLKSGYIGQYEFGKAFLVSEASSEAALQVFVKLAQRLEHIAPAQIGEEGFTGTDKYLGGILVFRKGRHVGGFANLQPGADAAATATRFAAALR